ncbi:hypothetical protein J4218_04815 [Candidatus Pacearchaeota archaeon]|nr:hypothetical protein [Candidatus Pacearchaeota archaeon]
MVKRVKRLERGIESLKQEIENHFEKIQDDISKNNLNRGRYHIKEIDKSLLNALELKIQILGIQDDFLDVYRKRLEEVKRKLKKES